MYNVSTSIGLQVTQSEESYIELARHSHYPILIMLGNLFYIFSSTTAACFLFRVGGLWHTYKRLRVRNPQIKSKRT